VTAKDGATVDATGVTGATTLQFDNAAKDYTVKGSSTAATTFTMGTQLDDGDTIEGGSATTDSLSATVNGLTATTGALSISGVETLALETVTAASTIDASSITGATRINFTGNGTNGDDGSQAQTLTNLGSGVTIGLGSDTNGANDTFGSSVAVSLADATGSSDTLTVELGARGANGDIAATLTGSGIETLTINDSATAKDASVNVNGFNATTINVTGGLAGELIDLSGAALAASTTTLDASTFAGTLTATAATNTATTISAKAAVGTITGGAAADNITIGTSSNYLGATIGTVDAGVGTDTLTVYAGSAVDLDGVTNVETINLLLDASDTDGYTINGGGGSDGIITASTVNVDGGVSGGTYVLSATLTDVANKVIDAGDVVGSVTMTFGDDALVVTNTADPVTITGGQAAADVVTLSMSGSNTGTFTMSGVETLNVGNDGTASTVNLANVTGLTKLILTDDAGTGAAVTASNMLSTTEVELGDGSNEFKDMSATLTLADATGSSDTLTVRLVDTDGTGTADTVTANGVENLTLDVKAGTEDHKIAVANTNANASTITVTGTDTDTTLELSSIASAITTVNAGSFASTLTVGAAARDATAMTITGGTGADSIAMENVADVLTGGAGTESDELVVNFAGTGGATVIDLSSTSDQVQLFNGLANSAVQTGFEDVDLSSYTQTASIGADITGSSGANIVAGTTNADSVRLGAGNDTYVLDDVTTDTVDAGTGTNSLSMVAGVDVANTVDFGTYTNFDKIVVNGASDTAYSLDLKADADTDMSDMRTVDFSADTSATGSNVIDLGLVSGTYDVTGGAGVETITGSLGADTIDGGAGADVITGGTGADSLSGGTGADTFHFIDGDSGAWNIDGTNAKLASTVNMDIILDAAATDKINLTAALETEADYDTFTTATAGADLTATTTTNTIAQFIGTYDADANTFLSDTSGDDIMLAFHGEDTGDTTVDEALIIVGQSNVYANGELTDGVLTIA